jgi:hypothetical protein
LNIDESKWVDLSTHSDRACGQGRYVETLGVEGGFGRTIRIELVGSANDKPPPEAAVTYGLYEWLRTGHGW